MTTDRAKELQVRITKEALALMVIHGESVSAAGEDASHVLPETELPMNDTGLETLNNVWDLFETAVQMDSWEQRMVTFKLASELAECQNLLDWIEKTAAERELPEIAAN